MLQKALICLGICVQALAPAYAEVKPINGQDDLAKQFAQIREEARSSPGLEDLSRLYKKASYLITVAYAPSWQKKYGLDVLEMRRLAREEFRQTVMEINFWAKMNLLEESFEENWADEPDEADYPGDQELAGIP